MDKKSFNHDVTYCHTQFSKGKAAKMIITPEIRKYLSEAVAHAGGVCEFSKRCQVDAGNISRYLNGRVASISDRNWERLKAHLLPEEKTPRREGVIRNTASLRQIILRAMEKIGISTAAELNRLTGYDSVHTLERLLSGELDYWFPDLLSCVIAKLELPAGELKLPEMEKQLLWSADFFNEGAMLVRPVPVVSWANAAGALELNESPDRNFEVKWDPETTETVPVPVGGRSRMLAFRVFGISMEPTINDGDVILVEPALPGDIPDHKIAVIRTDDGEVYCKRLHQQSPLWLLTSDNPAGKILHLDRKKITWLGVVVRKISEL